MPGSQTTPGPTGARNNAPADFAFRQVNNVGTRVANDFAAQWLAYTLPYRRFADALADACAQIGGDVDCYSLIAVDFHHILLASFPAHSLTLRPAGLLNRLKRPLSRGSSPAGYRTARQLPDQSTTLWVESSSTSDPRLRGTLPKGDIAPDLLQEIEAPLTMMFSHSQLWMASDHLNRRSQCRKNEAIKMMGSVLRSVWTTA